VNLLVEGRRCLVVGGGTVAAGKVAALLDAGAIVHVVAPAIGDAVRALAAAELTWDERAYEPGEAARYRLVITATGDPAVNAAVFADGEAAGVWVNAADDPAHCSFTLPARLRRGPVLVTVSTGGRSPAVSSWLRRRLEADVGPEVEQLVELVAEERDRLRAEGRATSPLDWQRALDSGMLELVRQGRVAEARELLQACLSSSSV
jgi:precorrin-2 dehydrogenase/sirohydrochlorin ferrochelatase